jgi:hypothetical protein
MLRFFTLLILLTLSISAFAEDKCVSDEGVTFVDALPSNLSLQISNSLFKNGEKMDDVLDKLDFSMPGEPGFDENAHYSALRLRNSYRERQFQEVTGDSRNWTKPRLIKFWYDYAHSESFVDQECIDHFTTEKGVRLIFNLRRSVRPEDNEWETLYAIIPKFDSAKCEGEQRLNVASFLIRRKPISR